MVFIFTKEEKRDLRAKRKREREADERAQVAVREELRGRGEVATVRPDHVDLIALGRAQERDDRAVAHRRPRRAER